MLLPCTSEMWSTSDLNSRTTLTPLKSLPLGQIMRKNNDFSPICRFNNLCHRITIKELLQSSWTIWSIPLECSEVGMTVVIGTVFCFVFFKFSSYFRVGLFSKCIPNETLAPSIFKRLRKNLYSFTWRWKRKARIGPKTSNFEGTTEIWKCSPPFFHNWCHWARKLISENRTMIELKNTVQTANWVTGMSFWMAPWSIDWLID